MSSSGDALERRLAAYRPLVLEEMRAIVGEERSGLYAWMRYHLGWEDEQGNAVDASPGKLLRPMALLLTTEALGGRPEQAAPAAAAVQLVHDFSLLHDDVEDGSERRRDRPTLWTFAGTAQAINTGDGMYTLARLALQRLREQGVSDARVLATMAELDRACARLVEGQYLDLSFEGRTELTREDYLAMIEGKTAALFAASFAIGAVLAGATEPALGAVRAFGLHVGLAFQAVDDLLGIWGEPQVTGKPVGDDLRTRKMTYPVISALQGGAPALAAAYRQAPGEPLDVAALSQEIEEVGGQAATEALAAEQIEAALDELGRLPIGADQRPLFEALARLASAREA